MEDYNRPQHRGTEVINTLPKSLARVLVDGWFATRRAQQRCEHFLQTADEHVGLSIAFEQRSDLPVFDFDLLAQEVAVLIEALDFPFQSGDDNWRFTLPCRILSWLVAVS